MLIAPTVLNIKALLPAVSFGALLHSYVPGIGFRLLKNLVLCLLFASIDIKAEPEQLE